MERVFGKDTLKTNTPADTSKKKGSETLNKLKGIFTKPKKPATDTVKKN